MLGAWSYVGCWEPGGSIDSEGWQKKTAGRNRGRSFSATPRSPIEAAFPRTRTTLSHSVGCSHSVGASSVGARSVGALGLLEHDSRCVALSFSLYSLPYCSLRAYQRSASANCCD